MSRLRFYKSKLIFLAVFIWCREGALVQAEWNRTYKKAKKAQDDFAKYEEEGLKRLLKAIEETES